jgi:hypothetical protein
MADASSPGSIGPRLRRAAGLASLATAFAFLTGGNPIPDVRERLDTLRRFWRMDAISRRLEGRACAYDRRFAVMTVAAAAELPAGTPGVVLDAPGIPDWGGRFFAVYHFAPTPVLLAPARVPTGWPTLQYGAVGETESVLRRFDGGALLLSAP